MTRSTRALDGLDDDIREHVALETEELIQRGYSPEEARRRALVAFGNVGLVIEDTRTVWTRRWLQELWHDTGYAWRSLRRSPAYAAVAVLTLGLGIGANAAVFSLVYATLIRPLPYPRPDDLVTVSARIPQIQERFPSIPLRASDVVELRRSSRALSELAAIAGTQLALTGSGEPEVLHGARVSANLLSVMGVAPAIGRAFSAGEDQVGRDQVAILSHDVWVRRFGADPSVVGRAIDLGGRPYTVVGVMPRQFLFPVARQLHPLMPLGPRIDVWTPLAFSPQEIASDGSWNYGIIARRAPGTSLEATRDELHGIASAIAARSRQRPGSPDFDLHVDVRSLREIYAGPIRRELLLLMAAVTALLLIACVNLTNLLLARVSTRAPEMATRMAIGASRWRLMRQIFTESAVVALLGAGVALVAAQWGAQLLIAQAPPDVRALLPSSLLSFSTLAFTLLVALVAGLVVGVAPALDVARHSASNSSRSGWHAASAVRTRVRLGDALVSAEAALTSALVVVAGLLLHSLLNVLSVDGGFRPERVLAVDLSLPSQAYSYVQADQFYRDAVARARALPGVQAAAAVNVLPLASESTTRLVQLEDDVDESRALERPVAVYRVATPTYFSTVGVPVLAGRTFASEEPQPAAVVSAGLVRRLWPTDPLRAAVGRRVRPGNARTPLVTIVGVVGDVHSGALDREPMPAIYQPQSGSGWRDMTVVLRTAGDPIALAAAIRAELNALDPKLPVAAMRTMNDVVSASVATRRFQTTLVMAFAVLALGLAAIGIYGVTSCAVSRRVRECGIRVALGATHSRVLVDVVTRGLRPVALGLLVGLIGAAWAARAIRSSFFGVEPLDPVAFVVAAVVLMLAALAACYVPARRAAGVDPIVALRLQ